MVRRREGNQGIGACPLELSLVQTYHTSFSFQVLTLCLIDSVGSLPEYIYVFDTNAYPLKYWDPERGGESNHEDKVGVCVCV